MVHKKVDNENWLNTSILYYCINIIHNQNLRMSTPTSTTTSTFTMSAFTEFVIGYDARTIIRSHRCLDIVDISEEKYNELVKALDDTNDADCTIKEINVVNGYRIATGEHDATHNLNASTQICNLAKRCKLDSFSWLCRPMNKRDVEQLAIALPEMSATKFTFDCFGEVELDSVNQLFEAINRSNVRDLCWQYPANHEITDKFLALVTKKIVNLKISNMHALGRTTKQKLFAAIRVSNIKILQMNNRFDFYEIDTYKKLLQGSLEQIIFNDAPFIFDEKINGEIIKSLKEKYSLVIMGGFENYPDIASILEYNKYIKTRLMVGDASFL